MTSYWRISNHLGLSGFGAELSDGRWHTAQTGKRVVYLAEHPAVALIENLVNLGAPAHFFPSQFQLLKITAVAQLEAAELTPEQIAQVHPQKIGSTQSLGDAWLASTSSALLRVPSIPAPESWNFLFNPQHPQATSLTIAWARPITYDRRLFHLAHA